MLPPKFYLKQVLSYKGEKVRNQTISFRFFRFIVQNGYLTHFCSFVFTFHFNHKSQWNIRINDHIASFMQFDVFHCQNFYCIFYCRMYSKTTAKPRENVQLFYTRYNYKNALVVKQIFLLSQLNDVALSAFYNLIFALHLYTENGNFLAQKDRIDNIVARYCKKMIKRLTHISTDTISIMLNRAMKHFSTKPQI